MILIDRQLLGRHAGQCQDIKDLGNMCVCVCYFLPAKHDLSVPFTVLYICRKRKIHGCVKTGMACLFLVCVCAIWFSLGACVIQIISRVMRVYLNELEDKNDNRYLVSASN